MLSVGWRRSFLWALILASLSWGAVKLGSEIANRGKALANDPDLFRFDSKYYLDIAEHGYQYNGDASSSPNIVFAPLFPLLASTVPVIGAMNAGFALNKIFFFLALTFLLTYLTREFGERQAVLMSLALATAAGSYSFHAYYSESTMFFFLALALLSWQRQWWLTLALSTALLGASRLTALPMLAVFAAALTGAAQREQRPRLYLYAAFCFTGAAAYLLYIGINFEEPFSLLESIQKSSWARFHPDVDWWRLLTGSYLFEYLGRAAAQGVTGLMNVATMNLLWVLLALASCIHLLVFYRRHALTYIFLPYFAFVYYAVAGSAYLVSAHRFFVLMVPIFLMFADLHGWLRRKVHPLAAHGVIGLLLLFNLVLGVAHAFAFEASIWPWF